MYRKNTDDATTKVGKSIQFGWRGAEKYKTVLHVAYLNALNPNSPCEIQSHVNYSLRYNVLTNPDGNKKEKELENSRYSNT